MAGCWLLSPTNKCLHAPITEWAFHQCLSLLQWHTLTCWATCWWSSRCDKVLHSEGVRSLIMHFPLWCCLVIKSIIFQSFLTFFNILLLTLRKPEIFLFVVLGWTPRRTPCLFHKFGGWKSSIGNDSAKRNGVIVSVFNQRATTKVLKIYVNLAVNNFEWITSVPCIW